MMPSAASAAPVVSQEAKVEKTSFDVKVENIDAESKIKTIREVRASTVLGLEQAKGLVENSPTVLKSGLAKDEAEQIIAKLKSVGATASRE